MAIENRVNFQQIEIKGIVAIPIAGYQGCDVIMSPLLPVSLAHFTDNRSKEPFPIGSSLGME